MSRTLRSIAVALLASLLLTGCRLEDVPIPLATSTPAPELTLTVGEDIRTYQLHAPEIEEPAEGWPLVIVVHGLGSDASGVRSRSGFDEIADDEAFLVAYPNGLSRAWIDAGLGATIADTDIASLNLDFFDAMIDEINDEYGVDPRRIYVTGISNGGMFTFHVACHLSERVAAVGLVAAASISQSYDNCDPASPVAYIAFHGTSDTVVPYGGGEIVPGFEDIGRFQSAHEAAGFWASVNGCREAPEREQLPDLNSGDHSLAYRESWAPCASDRPVELITLDGSGHTWPGHPPPGQRLGATNLDIDASEMLWDFFEANPKPENQ